MSPEYPSDSVQSPSETSVLCASMPLTWELFCSELALGETAVDAARKVGYSYEYADKLTAKAEIKERTHQYMVSRMRDGLMSRLWCELQLFKMAKDCSEDKEPRVLPDGSMTPFVPANYALASQLIMNGCKLKGYIVERKQSVAAKLDLTDSDNLPGVLEETLAVLSPEDRARIRDLSAGRRKRKTSVPSARSSAVVVDVPSSEESK